MFNSSTSLAVVMSPGKSHGEMHMIGHAADTIAFAIYTPGDRC